MYIKRTLIALFLTSTIFSAQPVYAGGRGIAKALAVVGAIAIIANIAGSQKRKRRNRRQSRRSQSGNSISQHQREIDATRMRDIQVRLTGLGHNTGGIDGKKGPMTRRAIGDFQTTLGHSRNSGLSEDEYQMLVSLTTTTEPDIPPMVIPAIPNNGNDTRMSPGFAENIPVEQQPSPNRQLPESPFGDVNSTYPTAQNDLLSDSINNVHRVRALIEDASFNVYGINLLYTKSQAMEKLASRNISNCRTTTTSIACSNNVPGLSETITVGFTKVQNLEKIHTISRTIQLQTRTNRNDVLKQFRAAYPRLVDAENQMIASSDSCKTKAGEFRKHSSAKLERWMNSGAAPSTDIVALASSCDYYYTLSLPEGNIVDQANITLFTGQPITSSLQTGDTAAVIPF